MHRLHVASLAVCSWPDTASSVRHADRLGGVIVALHDDRQRRSHVFWLQLALMLEQLPHLLKNTVGSLHLIRVALDLNRVAAGYEPYAKCIADHLQVGVALAE